MGATITMACNVYNECNAVHGLLECASQFFDEIFFFHTGPNGAYSNDGTIETIKKWGARIEFGSINEGFGVVRSELIRRSKSDWVMIMDADERFYPMVPVLNCEGSESYPQVANPNLQTNLHQWAHQGDLLRALISQPHYGVIRSCRRHWFDHSWRRPCQNWHGVPDWQYRIVRKTDEVCYDTSVKMHERLMNHGRAWEGDTYSSPYHDHFHCHYKPMEPEQRKEDIAIYNALHEGSVVPSACHILPE